MQRTQNYPLFWKISIRKIMILVLYDTNEFRMDARSIFPVTCSEQEFFLIIYYSRITTDCAYILLHTCLTECLIINLIIQRLTSYKSYSDGMLIIVLIVYLKICYLSKYSTQLDIFVCNQLSNGQYQYFNIIKLLFTIYRLVGI